MEQSVHRPLIKSGLFGWPSRQFRIPRTRAKAPVVAECCIDPTTAPLAAHRTLPARTKSTKRQKKSVLCYDVLCYVRNCKENQ